MAQEYKLILKYADEPGYTRDIECYLRHGGYESLKKALTMQPKDLPDGKKLSPQEQIREDVKISGLRGRGSARAARRRRSGRRTRGGRQAVRRRRA